MNIDRTKYTAHYENGIVVAQWISIDMALDGANGESALDALDRSKALVEQWYKANSPVFPDTPIPPGPPSVIQVHQQEIRIGVLVEDIMSCKELVVLDSYRLMVKGNDELLAAYEKRRKEIVGSEISGI